MSIKYSVIIPFFNSVPFFDKCLSFIKKTTRSDVEFILIDDCSKDHSLAYAKEYLSSSLNVIFLSNEINLGPGLTRNRGIKVANGEWIVFLDSDDSLSDIFFDVLDDYSSKCDVFVYDCSIFSSKGRFVRNKKSVFNKKRGFLSLDEFITITVGGIRKCFKKELTRNKDVMFPDFSKGEDFVFYLLLITNNPDCSIYYLDDPLYFAYQRNNSLSRGNDDTNIMPSIYNYLFSRIDTKYKDLLLLSSIRVYLYGGCIQLVYSKTSKKEIVKYITTYETIYPKWYKSINSLHLSKTKRISMWLIRHRFIILFRFICFFQRKINTR